MAALVKAERRLPMAGSGRIRPRLNVEYGVESDVFHRSDLIVDLYGQ